MWGKACDRQPVTGLCYNSMLMKIIGWTLIIIGLFGIMANVLGILIGLNVAILLINCLVCVGFILVGWRLVNHFPSSSTRHPSSFFK